MITIYTDGSSKGNPGPGGWGAVVANADKVVELGGGEPHTTNNRMELTAAIRALEFVSTLPADSYALYTDSQYVMKGITEWVHGWQKKGWKTASKKPVLNQDLWQELIVVADGKETEWKYVAGHTGVLANERCDVIATSFAEGEPIELFNGSRDAYEVSLSEHAE